MKLSIVTKLSLGAMLLVVISTSVTAWLFYSKTTSLLVEEAFTDISDEVRSAGQQLKFKIDTQAKDTLFLADTPPIQGMLRHLSGETGDKSTLKQWETRLQSIFITILASKSDYLTVRLIGKDGREMVVARRTENNIEVVAPLQLQDKSKRIYVKETLKIRLGKIYLSEITLNKENGIVTTPYQEVLRSATPIYDARSNKLSGLLVISSEIGNSLREIQDSVLGTGRDVFITNDYGAYLLHSDKSKTYGFDLGKQYRVQEDIPDVSELYFPDNKYKNIVLESIVKGERYVLNFSKIPFDTEKLERFIAVGMVEPYSQILENESELLSDVISRITIMAGIVMLFAMFFAFRLTKPIINITSVIDDRIHGREPTAKMPLEYKDEVGILARSFNSLMNQVDAAQKGLETMNRSLEDRVVERTKKLELSERRQRSVVDNMADGLITIDNHGSVLSFNLAAERIFGYQANEIIGCNVDVLMPEPFHSNHAGYLREYEKTGEKKVIGFISEVVGKKKYGDTFPMDLAVSEMDMGEQKIYSGVLRDITERKQIEKMKSEFISTVSHELRTPLTSIRGALGLITGGAVGELPKAIDEMLTIAGNNTQRLLFLINDILDIQKIEAGQMIFKFHSLELSKFIEEAMENNATYAKQHGITISIKNNLSDAYVFADKERLMQVMANLLSNAAKFSPKGGVVQIDVARHDGSIRISVTDSGKGIPDNFHSKIFEKFTQSDSSDTRQKGGTGLGLSISKIIVERHQGIIDFVTNKNVGTTFFFELSELLHSPENTNIDKPAKVRGDHSPCVLIVEDDNDAAILLQRMLHVAGYNADIVNTASQARQQLKAVRDPYKLIALDINLPEQKDVSFIEELHTNDATKKIPVVVISAEVGDGKLNLDGGVLDLIDWMKYPIDKTRLLDVVRQVVGNSKKIRVLHVEDETDVQRIVSGILDDSCDITCASTLAESNKILDSEEFDVVLLDIGLPDGSGLDLLDKINKQEKIPAVVIFSAYEVASSYKDKVNAILMKSTTDNFMLVEVVNNVVSHYG